MAFVRNAWYVAGFSSELTHEPARRTMLGEHLVLFRTEAGALAALRDQCPHRLMPLSLGRVVGDVIECGYHGLRFDTSGACVHVPGQDFVPPAATVRAYPVTERMGVAWVWMGDPALADAERVLGLEQFDDPRWGVGFGDALRVEANYLLLTDNLCDPAHVTYVHPTTLGSAEGEGIPVEVDWDAERVSAWRWTRDSEPVGFFKAFGDFDGRVDRWQYYHMHVPSVAVIDFGSLPAGLERAEERRDEGVRVYSLHLMTPETETTTVDRWMHIRNFAPDDDAISEAISEQFRIAFAEDKVVLEAIQREELHDPPARRAALAIDKAAVRFRRLIDARLREQAPHAVA